MLTAILDQTLMALKEGNVRRAPDQSHEIIVMDLIVDNH